MQNEVIWAPWRLAYIAGIQGEASPTAPAERPAVLPGGDGECFLCRCAAASDRRSHWVINRGPVCMTVMNCFPYNNGHLLVSPLRHVAGLTDLTTDEDLAIAQEIKRMVGVLQQVLKPEGFNVGLNMGRAAGAGVPGHLHWHIVPRWAGDTNCITTVAGVRVIPQSLEALWEALTRE